MYFRTQSGIRQKAMLSATDMVNADNDASSGAGGRKLGREADPGQCVGRLQGTLKRIRIQVHKICPANQDAFLYAASFDGFLSCALILARDKTSSHPIFQKIGLRPAARLALVHFTTLLCGMFECGKSIHS
jgi:hypothetical protein